MKYTVEYLAKSPKEFPVEELEELSQVLRFLGAVAIMHEYPEAEEFLGGVFETLQKEIRAKRPEVH